MKDLSDSLLVATLHKAVDLELEDEFIQLLLDNIRERENITIFDILEAGNTEVIS
ncbi:sporulation histidine kinase inhibitor Sda [Paenibacillus thalictri]|uniref:Sporulation histidine kinase inhibitor Sda n=2 Tax=Paenibacillus thalictri TaxID=2527873 RepID=A0A4Q9DP88_9BACL|nr:sporulation histidine kinase inhibitor Sda [Paenibacillus thalictri]